MLSRVLEPELMDTLEEAQAYDAMDHDAVNRAFVHDFLRAAEQRGAPIDDATPTTTAPAIHVLDLGCGTARQPIALCRRRICVRVTAVDAASHMLDVARRNISNAQLGERVSVVLADAKRLPFPNGEFRFVVSNSIVHHIPHPLDVVREAVRATAVGGLLFFRDLMRPESEERVAELVATYAADATDHQRSMFNDSLRAALSLGEIRGLVSQLGFAPETASATSDRHWTWVAPKSA